MRARSQGRRRGVGRRGREGFSLPELLLALIVISVTATASIWAYFSRSEITLDNAAKLLAQDVRLAQTRAAAWRTSVSIVFALDGDGYVIFRGIGDGSDASLDDKAIIRRYSRDAVFEGVRIDEIDVGPDRRIEFDAGGLATTDGRIRLGYRGDTRTLDFGVGRTDVRILAQ